MVLNMGDGIILTMVNHISRIYQYYGTTGNVVIINSWDKNGDYLNTRCFWYIN